MLTSKLHSNWRCRNVPQHFKRKLTQRYICRKRASIRLWLTDKCEKFAHQIFVQFDKRARTENLAIKIVEEESWSFFIK
jgi:hypothetical protein